MTEPSRNRPKTSINGSNQDGVCTRMAEPTCTQSGASVAKPRQLRPKGDKDEPVHARLRKGSKLPSAQESRTDIARPKRTRPYANDELPSRVKLCTAIALPDSALSRTERQLPVLTSEEADSEKPGCWRPLNNMAKPM